MYVRTAVMLRAGEYIVCIEGFTIETAQATRIGKVSGMPELPEEHHQGVLSIENLPFIQEMDLQNCDFGLQVAWDGRVWVCVNGVAFLRFKPTGVLYSRLLNRIKDKNDC